MLQNNDCHDLFVGLSTSIVAGIILIITVPVTAIITAIITIIIMYLLCIKHNKQSDGVPPETDHGAIRTASLTSPEISNNPSYGLQVKCTTPTQINLTTVPIAVYEPTYI